MPITGATPEPRSDNVQDDTAASPIATETTVPDGVETQSAGTAPPPITAPTNPPASSTSDASQIARDLPQWVIWAGGAFFAVMLGLFFWRRRKASAQSSGGLLAAPIAKLETGDADLEKANTTIIDTPEPQNTTVKLAAAPSEAIATKPDLDLKLEIEQLSRSMMMMTLKCRVTLSNRSDKAARDIVVAADMVSANRALPMEAQIAGETAFLPEVGSNERIGPHKTFSAPATLTLPIQQLAAFKQGNKPLFVPLVRVRMDAKGAEPLFRTFVVGIAADPSMTASTKLHPVPLDGIPGSYPNVRHRALENQPQTAPA